MTAVIRPWTICLLLLGAREDAWAQGADLLRTDTPLVMLHHLGRL